MSPGVQRGRFERLRRLVRRRLIVPVLRSRQPPEHTARGVALGVFWALTPTVGVQSVLLLASWWALGAIGRSASLVQTLAWTWINNPVTMVPLYYLFYVTGQLLLGRWADLSGYGAFAVVWREAINGSASLADRLRTAIDVLGWPALVGCLPWAVIGAAVAYRASLNVLARRAAAGRQPSARDDAGPEPAP